MTCPETAPDDLWPAVWGGVAGIGIFVIAYLVVWVTYRHRD